MDGIRYQLMAAANEDFGNSFDLRTEAKNGLRRFPFLTFRAWTASMRSPFSNPPIGDFAQLNNSLAVSGRVDFSLPQTPGSGWSVSAYYSPNIEPAARMAIWQSPRAPRAWGFMTRNSVIASRKHGLNFAARAFGDVRRSSQFARQQ